MKKGLLAIFVFGAALCFGGYVAQAQEQHFMADGEQKIAEIEARKAILEAEGYVNRVRPFWSEDENLPRTPVPAPLPIASSPQSRATVAPVVPPPIAKPPVVAAPVVEKPKDKAVEQAKVQAPVKSPQAATHSVNGLIVTASKILTDYDYVTIRGVKYKKGKAVWAVIYETKDGKIVNKEGEPANEPEIADAPPRGAKIGPPITIPRI